MSTFTALVPNTRIVRCCHCNGMMRVSAKAMSVFCPHCQKRAPLENLRITGSHPGKTLSTCGDIFIEPTAKLHLSITGTRVFVQGRVRGSITAAELVEIFPGGHVEGAVRAPKILVQDGGVIEGRCEIMRKPEAAPPVEANGRTAHPGGDVGMAAMGAASQPGSAVS